jgi:ribonucleoside-diphosphate reductase alpha chain
LRITLNRRPGGISQAGVYEEEIFITMAKQGSTISRLMDSFATAVSLALQYGVPLEVLCSKFTHKVH